VLKKIEKIDITDVANYNKLRAAANTIENNIADRIEYVLKKIYEVYGGSFDTWYFDGAAEGEVGDIHGAISSDYVSGFVFYGRKGPRPMGSILHDETEVNLEYDFPTRWLYEEFEDELAEGKQKFLDKSIKDQKAAQINRDAKKLRDEQILDIAKKKFSKEELAALKRIL
jgi:hypothetical protein